jgi:hypothetical protein
VRAGAIDRRRVVLLTVAACAFILGWVLPVIDEYRGWQAFRVALSPLWPYENFKIDGWHNAILTPASGLTNLLFALAFAELALRRKLNPRAIAWLLVGATLLNMYWLVLAGEAITDIAIGYYVWLVSFPLLALAARR